MQRIAEAITPFLGEFGGKLLFGLGMAGAALVGAIVVSLTAARTLSEMLGVNCSLDRCAARGAVVLRRYTVALIVGAASWSSGVNLVSLSVGVQVMNALLLPLVLGFLFLLARRLPEPWRLRGVYAALCASIIARQRRFWRLFGRGRACSSDFAVYAPEIRALLRPAFL